MKDLTYIEYLFLDCISTGRPIKEATLFYTLIGKRTVSTMLQCRQYDLEAYFTVMPGMKPTALKKWSRAFGFGWTDQRKRGRGLSAQRSRSAKKADFFSRHAHFSLGSQLEFALVQSVLRRRMLFDPSPFRNKPHKNKHYYPVEREAKEQLWMKRLLTQQAEIKPLLHARLWGRMA